MHGQHPHIAGCYTIIALQQVFTPGFSFVDKLDPGKNDCYSIMMVQISNDVWIQPWNKMQAYHQWGAGLSLLFYPNATWSILDRTQYIYLLDFYPASSPEWESG